MKKDNKIISFTDIQKKKRKKPKYELREEISVYLARSGESYKFNWSSPNPKISYERIYEILSSIFMDLTKKVKKIGISKMDRYEVCFTILYFENTYNKKEFKYICQSQNISNEKLAQYLFISLSMYELEETGDI